jgi:hypothetical protein
LYVLGQTRQANNPANEAKVGGLYLFVGHAHLTLIVDKWVISWNEKRLKGRKRLNMISTSVMIDKDRGRGSIDRQIEKRERIHR